VCANVWRCFYSLTVQQTISRVLRCLMRGLPDDGTCFVLKHVRNFPTSAEHILCMSSLLLTYLLRGAQSLLRSLPVFAASQEIPCIFMEYKGSLPYSQLPATCPYPEPTPSSPQNPLQLPEIHQYYHPIYVWVSPMASFPQVSPPTPCAHLCKDGYSN
jgi:hypothetical protein